MAAAGTLGAGDAPPWASTVALAMASPRPSPPNSPGDRVALPCSKAVKIPSARRPRGRSRSRCPAPPPPGAARARPASRGASDRSALPGSELGSVFEQIPESLLESGGGPRSPGVRAGLQGHDQVLRLGLQVGMGETSTACRIRGVQIHRRARTSSILPREIRVRSKRSSMKCASSCTLRWIISKASPGPVAGQVDVKESQRMHEPSARA